MFPQKQQQNGKKSHSKGMVINHPTSAPPKTKAPPPPKMMSGAVMPPHSHISKDSGHKQAALDQKDRSLTVMIPRAKYHPNAQPPQQPQMHLLNPQNHHSDSHQQVLIQTNSLQLHGHNRSDGMQPSPQTQTHLATATITSTGSVCSNTEAKLLSYLDASPSASKV